MKKRKFASCALALTVLIVALVGVQAGYVRANFTPLPALPAPVYIRSDGSVEPATAPLQRTGDIYMLTSNINNTIEMQRSNIVLDGNGFVLTKPTVNTEGLMMPVGWLPGVHVLGVNNVTIKDIVFEYCITGVTIENASSVTLSQNTIREANCGIAIFSSSYINITDNDITLSDQFFATGINFLPSNPQASSPHCINMEGNRIVGSSIEVPAQPPQPKQYGIWGGFSDSKMVGNNLLRISGIALYYTGSNNLIAGNNFEDNYEGIFFTGSSGLSVDNTIYGNNFNHNSNNVVVPFIRNPPPNRWDNGTKGNYWSDYNGTDQNGDGIGDTLYRIETIYYDYEAGKNVTVQEGKDNFPLMVPVDIPKSITQTTPLPSPTPTTSPFTLAFPSASASLSPSSSLLPTTSPSEAQALSPSPLPTAPEFQWWTILPLLAAASVAFIIFNRRGKAK